MTLPCAHATHVTSAEHWKNSKQAKQDALLWVNQRNVRIVLEHVTAELLQAQVLSSPLLCAVLIELDNHDHLVAARQPDDPLEFMIQKLQEGQQYNAEVARDRPPTAAS